MEPPLSPVKKVLLLGVDGVRPDALAAASTPNYDELIAQGAYSPSGHTGDITYSGPGWATFLCGVWRDKHGVDDNSFSDNDLAAYPDLFTLAESVKPELDTAALITWVPIADEIVTGADFEVAYPYDEDGDDQVVAVALELLSGDADPDLLFIYWGDVDIAGHDYGFSPESPEYLAEIEEADADLGQILAAIRARPTFAEEDWLVLMSTDHGGTPDGTHGENIPAHRTIAFLAHGQAVAPGPIFPGPALVDVVPTVLTHLGIDLDPAWALDGRAAGLSPSSPPPVALDSNLLFNGDAEYDRGFAAATPDGFASGWDDPGSMTLMAYGSPGYPDLDAPGPPDRGDSFFAGGASERAWLSQRVDVTGLSASIDADSLACELSGWLGGYGSEEDAMSVTAYFRQAGATADMGGKAGFFSGDELIWYDIQADATDAGFPAPIDATIWPPPFSGSVDAAVNPGNGQAWLFNGDQVLILDLTVGAALEGYPRAMSEAEWPGFGAFTAGLDAAVAWDNGKVFFFRGGEYLRWDIAGGAVDPGYPLPIDDTTWPGLGIWADGLDAAIDWGNGRAYMFRGSQYVRYDMAADAVDPGYPLDISDSTWPGVWQTGVDAAFRRDTPWITALGSLTIGPVSAAERGELSGLFARSATGTLPVGTREILVMATAVGVSGAVNDGYADGLSLVLTTAAP